MPTLFQKIKKRLCFLCNSSKSMHTLSLVETRRNKGNRNKQGVSMSEEIKRIDIKEFREKGFLQEVNRQFFHPLGLALEIIIDWPENMKKLESIDPKLYEEQKEKFHNNPSNHPDAVYKLGSVWDYRNDPEGIFYGKDVIDKEKIDHVNTLRNSKIQARLESGNSVTKYGMQIPEPENKTSDED